MRVLLVQPSLQPPGGGNAVAAWLLQALRDEHRLSVLTLAPVDLEAINAFYGTDLGAGDFELLSLPEPWAAALRALPGRLLSLRMAALTQRARELRPRFDLAICAHNEADLGEGPAIQYIHHPTAGWPRPEPVPSWSRGLQLTSRAYLAAAALAGEVDAGRMRRNLTLVNSDFVGAWTRAVHGVSTHTLYPPVHGTFAQVPWDARVPAFAMVGRVAPSKRIEQGAAIVARLRARGHGVTLHLYAAPGDTPEDEARVRRLAGRHPEWIHLRWNTPRAGLVRDLPRVRFGLHAMIEEHFGIAVAELQRAGCVTFAHRSGGPVEILGADAADQLWEDEDDAVDRIDAVLRDPERQRALHARALGRAERFSAERFMAELRAVVARFG